MRRHQPDVSLSASPFRCSVTGSSVTSHTTPGRAIGMSAAMPSKATMSLTSVCSRWASRGTTTIMRSQVPPNSACVPHSTTPVGGHFACFAPWASSGTSSCRRIFPRGRSLPQSTQKRLTRWKTAVLKTVPLETKKCQQHDRRWDKCGEEEFERVHAVGSEVTLQD